MGSENKSKTYSFKAGTTCRFGIVKLEDLIDSCMFPKEKSVNFLAEDKTKYEILSDNHIRPDWAYAVKIEY